MPPVPASWQHKTQSGELNHDCLSVLSIHKEKSNILCKISGDTDVQLTSSACVSTREVLVTMMQAAGSCHRYGNAVVN